MGGPTHGTFPVRGEETPQLGGAPGGGAEARRAFLSAAAVPAGGRLHGQQRQHGVRRRLRKGVHRTEE